MVELKDTLLMPKTKFPMRGNLPNKEPEFLKRWEEMDLYRKVLEKNAGKPSYVLHDGPPYANGNIHIGHALNKILKDFIVKYKNMNGFVSNYVPGWDTHGLPIEQVLVNNGVDRKSMPATKFRNKCKDYALKQVDKQRADFKKLGVIGDWENPYLTLDPKFEAEQIRVFGKMVDKGYIYKGLKPIYWSPSSESALAEAEIEYRDHTSPSIYVGFELVSEDGVVEKGTKFVIWTTTPWTLPANLGIAVHPDFEYQEVKVNGENYLLAKERVNFLAEQFGWENFELGKTVLGKELEFKVIKLDQKRNNVVVSRRAVIESENSQEREQILENLAEGSEVKGIVKNLTDYGAFVDLGGVDGLLHITDMAWKRVKHPSEIVNVGDEVTVKVLKFDKDRTRVSLGLKQLGQDPWVAIAENHPVNSKLTGKVTNLTDYGCFVEILDGVEGLVHVSEMDWTNKNIHPSKVVSLGDTVEVMVLEVDEERRRISLGLKQCKPNPWTQFAETHNKGDKVTGKIKSITDFGIFIGLEGGIDGLVHLSDISWNVPGEEAVRNYKKGDEVSAVVLAVDAVKERISLGIKQLEDDPFNNFVAINKKGAVVSATVVEADAKGAKVELAGGVEGYIRAADLTNEVAPGDVVEAKYTGVDRKARIVHLSVKAKDQAEEAAAVANVNTKQEDVAIPNAMAEAFKAAKGE
mgnify:CR=1 FL=1